MAADKLFEKETHWKGIVSLLVLSGSLAKLCVDKGHSADVEIIYRITSWYINDKLRQWIIHIGGWEMFVAWAEDNAMYLDRSTPQVSIPELSTVTLKKEADIQVRTSQDMKTCITGSALISPGIFLLTDHGNHCVKLVDVSNRTVTSSLQLPRGAPWDVCVLPDDQAAVTLPYFSMIQLVSTKRGQLSSGKKIKVSSQCHGIAYYNNRLYVSYAFIMCIEVMTLDGHIISTFQRNDGKQVCNAPFYLTLSASTPPTLYVSDYTADTVLKLTLDGKVLRKYRDEQLKYPMSVVELGPGQLLVCGQGSHNVMLLTEWDGKMTEILGMKDGLFLPRSIAFCPHTRAVVVGMFNYVSLKVFYANRQHFFIRGKFAFSDMNYHVFNNV
ncbi:uncharacterized protein LOC128242837 isoform X2 [Mya arenaria]|uniref:uncharacterized protein LOC128242837 isoform X2 n=1 Tax=Mya arenaria TaxID=6604 RepID=UPI0022E616FB|nr:uncharacterized protein LOC128242837 isoform X2 [Mya arenaria]